MFKSRHRCHNDTRSVLHGSTMASLTLPDLPLEIILNITDCLQPRSTTCLALTCKKLYNTERLKHIWTCGFDPRETRCGCSHEMRNSSTCPPLPLVNHEKYLFLQILSRNLPGKQLCDHCQCFHQQHEISIPRPWHKPSQLSRACGWTSVTGKPFSFFRTRYQLHFADAQQIMNRYRRREPSFMLSIRLSINTDWSPQTLSYKEDDPEEKAEAEIFVRLIVEANINSGHMIIHPKQTMCITVESEDMGWAHSGLASAAVMKVCPHAESSDKILKDTDVGLRALSSHKSVSGVRKFMPEGTNRCTSCLTEFSLSIDHQEEEGYQMIVESWTNLGTCEWSHQPAWQAATADTVLPDRFTLHQNTTTAFKTIRGLGYPSAHGCRLANKSIIRTVQPWPRIPLMDRLRYSFDLPMRPPTSIRESWTHAPPDTSLQWSRPNCLAPIPLALPSSPLPPSALPSETSSSQASSPRTPTPPTTASHTCPPPASLESVSTGPALSALIPASTSPISTPSQANSSLELVDDQAS